MDDEKIIWNNHVGVTRKDGVVEIVHVRAAEYFSIGSGTDMVGIRITYGDQTRQHVDVTKKHYDEHGLDELVLRAIETREKLKEQKRESDTGGEA